MKPLTNKKWWWLILIIAVVLINYIASVFHERIDLTNEKRFSISQPVKALLRTINQKMEIYIFLRGDIPAGFKKLSVSAQETLQEFQEYSNGNIHYKLISADEKIPGTEKSFGDSLASLGLVPINLKVQLKEGEQSQYIYPAALISYQGKLQPVNLYPGSNKFITAPELNSAEALLEYNFASGIEKISNPQKPLVAYAVGNGEPIGPETYDLVENVLKKNYQLFMMDLQKEAVIPDTFKLLLIVKPSLSFSEEEKLKIDQYVMRGGKLLFFVDRLNAEADSLQLKNEVIAYDRNLNLQDLLFKYGTRVNPDLLMDLQCDFLPFSVNGKDQFEFLHWNYFPLFESPQNSVINKNLGLVEGKFVNTIDTVSAPGITKTILLKSSSNSRTIETPALISGAENRNAPEDAAFNKSGLIAGVLLEGKFSSLYKNRISRQQMDSLNLYGVPFRSENIENNKMIIVADGDIVLNGSYKNQLLPMGVNPYTVGTQYEYQFANRQFVINCMEYLVNDAGLAEAKSKDYKLRLLDPKKTTEQRGLWELLNIVLPVLLIIIFGLVYQAIRKRKYTV
ncbi:gliding motility-associated ABC transporter substrate-binding protein GldG [Hanamia caeni]|jgi:gliding-associated putative ABC transporter substrate-binding component GldG|uniref:Gliding motility-associated ABC transporter substrate-binding protein GldG n=1 Tax=Hanamia caeni TaxID=2294116 RepID=A0A3M9NJG5_9BACT|nr:gliding motility-associated ABC transporter substrate-binding protein GldG [Hanamia caeni]RNI37930.1 gliding motility-associated ABC transporter substrate-binding protein GldG [Hanamia caeni]